MTAFVFILLLLGADEDSLNGVGSRQHRALIGRVNQCWQFFEELKSGFGASHRTLENPRAESLATSWWTDKNLRDLIKQRDEKDEEVLLQSGCEGDGFELFALEHLVEFTSFLINFP